MGRRRYREEPADSTSLPNEHDPRKPHKYVTVRFHTAQWTAERSRPRIEGHATSVVVVAGFPAGQASARALGLLARDSLKLVPQGVLSWQPPLQVVEEILEEGDVN